MIWLLAHAALADCMGPSPTTTPTSKALPTKAVLFHFIDKPDAPQPIFAVEGAEGAPVPFDAAARDGGPAATVWALDIDAPPGPVRVLADGREIASYTAVASWAQPASPALQEVGWSRYAWACSHEDALVATLTHTDGLAAWALGWGDGEIVLPPSTNNYFGSYYDDAPLRVTLGEPNCMYGATVDWSGVPDSWTLQLTPVFADGRRGAPIVKPLDLAALRAAATGLR